MTQPESERICRERLCRDLAIDDLRRAQAVLVLPGHERNDPTRAARELGACEAIIDIARMYVSGALKFLEEQ